MGKRRFISSSEDEDEEKIPPPSSKMEEGKPRRKIPKEEQKETKENKARKEDNDDSAQTSQEDAKPIGVIIKVSGKGRGRKNHYREFEYDGNRFELEDPVLLTPEEPGQKPYVAIIKDITQSKDGSMMVTGQWFYRPEEAEKRGGGCWQARDTRELFYSFHRDEVPAESVMHKCVVHFVPLNKQLPLRSKNPGFIVQKVYDTVEKKLWKLTDKDYEDNKQHEINLLVQKTRECLGELPDIEIDDTLIEQEDPLKNRRPLRRRVVSPIDISRDDEATAKSEQLLKSETPGSCTNESSEFYAILANLNVLTKDAYRDKWLEKLLQAIQVARNSNDAVQIDDKQRVPTTQPGSATQTIGLEILDEIKEKDYKDSGDLRWPEVAVDRVVALENASHETLGSDFQKYNQKMRQLVFNIKANVLLATRLLNGELKPNVILNMTPNELKEGLTAEEKATKEPEESVHMQMTDAKCDRCSERKVGVVDIIHAGGTGDRYQLQCVACGNTWYASRDAISSLTIDAPKVGGNVGTAPWATAKFEDVQKQLVSPRDLEKPVVDIFQKTTAAYIPVLENQKSFNRSKAEEPAVLPAGTQIN